MDRVAARQYTLSIVFEHVFSYARWEVVAAWTWGIGRHYGYRTLIFPYQTASLFLSQSFSVSISIANNEEKDKCRRLRRALIFVVYNFSILTLYLNL